MTVLASSQMTLDFEPGLTERFSSLLDCIRNGVYTNRKPLKTVAADMDMSQSELSRKLAENPDDVRKLSVEDFETYIEKTGDITPIYYLVEKFLQDEDMRKKRALGELVRKLPDIMALFQAATADGAK
jgi:hypothetical protein